MQIGGDDLFDSEWNKYSILVSLLFELTIIVNVEESVLLVPCLCLVKKSFYFNQVSSETIMRFRLPNNQSLGASSGLRHCSCLH